MQRIVKKIPFVPTQPKAKRVAAYARVSTEKDAMLHSLSAQVGYYSELIQKHQGWQYAGVYADEATSGTKNNRENFQRLLNDCREGKIDMVITKSISRFARNTVTLLETVRELKKFSVDVYFEEQNIHSMSADGELMLTILASYAQEESLSASENVKWQIRKGFENGELINLRFLFGYTISKGEIEIDPLTAPIVQEVFDRAIDGESLSSIAKDLNKRKIRTVTDSTWSALRVREMLSNEKYTGNALLQKSYINNHIEKKKCLNRGELPMFYAEGTHPAIIDITDFEKAQVVLKDIAEKWKQDKQTITEFSRKIRCSRCGKNYKRIIRNGSAGWNCSTTLTKGIAFCHGKKIPEETLKIAATEALHMAEYSKAEFLEKVDFIEVPDDNLLIFHFIDGTNECVEWADRSRRESWTDDMREMARQRATLQRRKNQ